MRYLLFTMIAALCATAGTAQSMNAEQFHQRATKLKAKGPLALFSKGEINALMAEGKAAGQAARAQRLAAVAAGQTPRYCPPGKGSMGSDEFMSRLAGIPQAERRQITMTEATTRIMMRKYPCAK